MTLKEALQNGMAAKQTDKLNRSVIIVQPFTDGPLWLHTFYDEPFKCTSIADAQAQSRMRIHVEEEGWVPV